MRKTDRCVADGVTPRTAPTIFGEDRFLVPSKQVFHLITRHATDKDYNNDLRSLQHRTQPRFLAATFRMSRSGQGLAGLMVQPEFYSLIVLR